MPPLDFVGSGNAYQSYAVKRRPRACPERSRGNDHERLYHSPCPNVHHHGSICPGNTPFPVCSAESIEAALNLFMENSLFNGDLSLGKRQSHPEDLRELWAVLDGRKRFPLSELVPAGMTLLNLL